MAWINPDKDEGNLFTSEAQRFLVAGRDSRARRQRHSQTARRSVPALSSESLSNGYETMAALKLLFFGAPCLRGEYGR